MLRWLMSTSHYRTSIHLPFHGVEPESGEAAALDTYDGDLKAIGVVANLCPLFPSYPTLPAEV